MQPFSIWGRQSQVVHEREHPAHKTGTGTFRTPERDGAASIIQRGSVNSNGFQMSRLPTRIPLIKSKKLTDSSVGKQ